VLLSSHGVQILPAGPPIKRADDECPHDRPPLLDRKPLVAGVHFRTASQGRENGFVSAPELFREETGLTPPRLPTAGKPCAGADLGGRSGQTHRWASPSVEGPTAAAVASKRAQGSASPLRKRKLPLMQARQSPYVQFPYGVTGLGCCCIGPNKPARGSCRTRFCISCRGM
jgi:hypothetical protein